MTATGCRRTSQPYHACLPVGCNKTATLIHAAIYTVVATNTELQAEKAMDTVSALVAELDVTEASLQGTDPPAAGPSPAAAAMAPLPDKPTRGGRGKAPAADKATVTVYNRDNKRSTAVAVSHEQLTSKPAAGKKAPAAKTGNTAVAQEAAENTHAEEDQPFSNSRPARQRGIKAQPYWMGWAGAAPASSPAPKEAQANSSGSDAAQEGRPQPAEAQQGVGPGAKTGMAGKAKKAPAVAKRQTRSSPHKEQQPAKRSRAASKQQQSEEQLQHEAETEVGAEAAMEVGTAAKADQVAQQPAMVGDEARQAGGNAGTAQTEDSTSAAVQKAEVAEDVDRLQQQDAVCEPAAVVSKQRRVSELQKLSIVLAPNYEACFRVQRLRRVLCCFAHLLLLVTGKSPSRQISSLSTTTLHKLATPSGLSYAVSAVLVGRMLGSRRSRTHGCHALQSSRLLWPLSFIWKLLLACHREQSHQPLSYSPKSPQQQRRMCQMPLQAP